MTQLVVFDVLQGRYLRVPRRIAGRLEQSRQQSFRDKILQLRLYLIILERFVQDLDL